MIYESLLLMLVHLIQHPPKSTRGRRWDLAAGGGHHKSRAPLDPCRSSLSPWRALIPTTTLQSESQLIADGQEKSPLPAERIPGRRAAEAAPLLGAARGARGHPHREPVKSRPSALRKHLALSSSVISRITQHIACE